MSAADAMERAVALVERHFGVREGRLVVGGVPVEELAACYGTPLFAYDGDVIDRRIAELRAALPERFDLFYSVKANPNLALLRRFLDAGCGLEIASAGEFAQARAAGCVPQRMLFAGPGKTDGELELVIEAGIGEIHAESAAEVERLAATCRRLGRRQQVALRVNPGEQAAGGAMRMGGTAAPFGIDEEQLDPVVAQLLGHDALSLSGIHLFAGTQILSHEVLLAQYTRGIEIARRVAGLQEGPLGRVDFGGGLGIPYFPGETGLDLAPLRAGLDGLLAPLDDDPAFQGTRFLLEPGRFLVGESGVYLTRVTDAKSSRGKRFLVCDGGMHHHLAASGNLGTVIRRNFPIVLASCLDGAVHETVDVVGPLCTPLDTVGRDVSLPRAEPGDLVAILQSGAYARAASPLGFLSHPAPPEVLAAGGAHALVRSRGSVDDLLRDQPLPGA